MLDTLARNQSHRAWAPMPHKRPNPDQNPHQVYPKNLPRAVARVQRARAISLSKLPVRKRPWCQSVGMFKMFRHRYTLRHDKISTRQSPLLCTWSEIGQDPWVMRIVHGGTESRLRTSHHWRFRACIPITHRNGAS